MGAKGIAQIVVLWALLLLGALAMAFGFSMRTEALASRNGLEAARAYYQARTGIHRAVAELAARGVRAVAGTTITGSGEGSSYEVRVEAESGKMDINFVSEPVLKEMLKNGGLSVEEADRVGDAILDWKDEDDRPREHGAEEAEYLSLHEPIRPRNARMTSVEELRYVMGVTPEFFRKFLSRVFTVHSRMPQVDVHFAPAEVLRALPGFSPEMAETLIAKRNESPFRSPAEVAALFQGEGIPSSTFSLLTLRGSSNVVTLTATGRAEGGIVRVVRCTVNAGGAAARGSNVIIWNDYAEKEEQGE